MAKQAPFESIHRHGFVRVSAASPTGSSGDVAFNVDQAIDLARPAGPRGRPPLRLPRRASVRSSAASPTGSSGDVAVNVDQAIDLARQAGERGCDLVVFPELNIS